MKLLFEYCWYFLIKRGWIEEFFCVYVYLILCKFVCACVCEIRDIDREIEREWKREGEGEMLKNKFKKMLW